MSTIGAHGKWQSNSQRDLLVILGRPLGTSDVYVAKIPLHRKGQNAEWLEHPFLLPHELFDIMSQERPGFFQEHVVGPTGELKRCWLYLCSKPFIEDEIGDVGQLDDNIPLGLHCDAGLLLRKMGCMC